MLTATTKPFPPQHPMPTLYQLNPTHWDKLAAWGFPSLRGLSKRFTNFADMDRALGTKGAVSNWHTGKVTNPRQTTENRAKAVLEAPVPITTPMPAPPPPAPAPSTLHLVTVPAHRLAAFHRVLGALDCSVETL